jgi:hypothetical protein
VGGIEFLEKKIMTEAKKTTQKKTPTPKAATNAMNKADLVSIVTALILSRGSMNTPAAMETAKYIVETAHESA